jgi:hypothetical protein
VFDQVSELTGTGTGGFADHFKELFEGSNSLQPTGHHFICQRVREHPSFQTINNDAFRYFTALSAGELPLFLAKCEVGVRVAVIACFLYTSFLLQGSKKKQK